jgi:hypothetical protein
MRDMQNGTVLDAGARTDLDGTHVTAYDRCRPHRRVVTDRYLTDHDSGWMDVNTRSERGSDIAIGL